MKYLVTIDYNHKKGFEMSEDMVVVAPDQEGAISYLSGLLSSRASVKSIARTRAISIEPIESPAPTDWGKEFAKNQDLRGKAMQYIAQMVDKHGSIKLPDPLWLAEDDKHTQWGEYSEAFICLDMDGLYITEPDDTDKDMMLVYLEDSIVIEIAGEVQKAIAGGDWK